MNFPSCFVERSRRIRAGGSHLLLLMLFVGKLPGKICSRNQQGGCRGIIPLPWGVGTSSPRIYSI